MSLKVFCNDVKTFKFLPSCLDFGSMRLMEIVYLGHACFKLKSSDTKILIDPFDPKMVGIRMPREEVDGVLITHHHQDHSYIEAARGYRKIVDGPGEYEIGGISIFGFPTYHDDKDGKERGENTIYLIEAEGIRVLHLGDLGHILSEKQVELVGNVNVLMLPVGDKYSLGPKEAGKVVADIEPQIVIPMHYFFEGINKEYFGGLLPVEDFLNEVSLPVERISKILLKSSDLTEDQKVVLLERK